MNNDQRLASIYEQLDELHRLQCIRALLGWDQKVLMPASGAHARAGQIECLSGLIHARWTDPKFMEHVESLHGDSTHLGDDDAVNVKRLHREISRLRKLPATFVKEKARATSHCYAAWTEAKPRDDFKSVLAHLERLVALTKEEARLLGPSAHPYDALLDRYEPDLKTEAVLPLLKRLGEKLQPIIGELEEREWTHNSGGRYPTESQRRLMERIGRDCGFSGRIDIAPHPFCTQVGAGDSRVTVRYDEADFVHSLYHFLHEIGHALYDDGLPAVLRGRPLGTAISIAFHESQSRLWENFVGRSRAFCRYLSRVAADAFPEQPTRLGDELWRTANEVRRGFIRIESDEVTYSIHILIRALLEEQLLTDKIMPRDLPAAWNELYRHYLRLDVSRDGQGVLQDMHWYIDSFGYFPTYVVGNLYSAMLWEKIRRDVGKVDDLIEAGNFTPILQWLRTHVHCHGQRYTSEELIKRLTGETLHEEPFLRYLGEKFALKR